MAWSPDVKMDDVSAWPGVRRKSTAARRIGRDGPGDARRWWSLIVCRHRRHALVGGHIVPTGSTSPAGIRSRTSVHHLEHNAADWAPVASGFAGWIVNTSRRSSIHRRPRGRRDRPPRRNNSHRQARHARRPGEPMSNPCCAPSPSSHRCRYRRARPPAQAQLSAWNSSSSASRWSWAPQAFTLTVQTFADKAGPAISLPRSCSRRRPSAGGVVLRGVRLTVPVAGSAYTSAGATPGRVPRVDPGLGL